MEGRKVLTTCGLCGCGCGIYVQPEDGAVAAVVPSENHPVNQGRLCIRGWNGVPAVVGPERLQTPLMRRNGDSETVSWKDAIAKTGAALRQAIATGGAHSVGIIGSGRMTNEECYSLARFARGMIRTPNLDSACRFYDASLVYALLESTGIPASEVDLQSLANAGAILVVGADPTEQCPILGSRIREASDNGSRIIAVDPRCSRLAPFVELFLHPRPGTDLIWLRALINQIMLRKLYFGRAPELAGFEALRDSVSDASLENLIEACGLDGSQVVAMAEVLAGSSPLAVVFGAGVLQGPSSMQVVQALANVALLLGGSILPVRTQSNAQGAWDMGLAHDLLPGYGLLGELEERKKWESAWGCKLNTEPGRSAADIILACESKQIKALLVFGDNLLLSAPDPARTKEALRNLDFLAVSDLYMTETAEMADVVFPACSFLEKEGTFTNIERRVQRVRKVLEPVGESRPDLEIIADLAEAMHWEIGRDPAGVMAEIAALVPQYKMIDYRELESGAGVQWAIRGTKGKLLAIPASAVRDSREYPFRLISSRLRFPHQTGTMCARSPLLVREFVLPYAELNERDAEDMGLKAGSRISISGKQGSLVRHLRLSDEIPQGCVHVPHFFGGDSPNAMASFECDSLSGAPVYKAISVKVEAAK